MPTVRMLKATSWDGQALKVGDETDVAPPIAARWRAAGIAERVAAPEPAPEPEPTTTRRTRRAESSDENAEE